MGEDAGRLFWRMTSSTVTRLFVGRKAWPRLFGIFDVSQAEAGSRGNDPTTRMTVPPNAAAMSQIVANSSLGRFSIVVWGHLQPRIRQR